MNMEPMNVGLVNIPVNLELVSTEAMDAETSPITTRRRRKKSMVWEHFTIEVVSGGHTKARCKLCKQTFAYSNGSKVAGTSHLKRHISLGSCLKIRNERQKLPLTSATKIEGDTTDPPKRRYRTSTSMLNVFDQEHSCTCLAKMIILHEYPLHMVENSAFVSFVQSLQSQLNIFDADTMEGEILSIYRKEKQSLMHTLQIMPGRISLTVGLWTTSQTLGYICLSGQFIDSEWKLHRRMLNFFMVSSPHSENALSVAISISLSDWNMKSKLFGITLENNCSSHDIYSVNLRDHLSNKNALMLKGQFFVVRCYANILNVVAKDLITSIQEIVYNIRESVKLIKVSQWAEKIDEISSQTGIPVAKVLSLDVTTLWNTTYHMLVTSLEYRHAFTFLETCDDNYNEAPTDNDWKKVTVVCTYLKLLYDSANTIMTTLDQTANIFFHEAWKIQLELTNAISGEDTIVSSIAKKIHETFDKYWKDCSLVLAIAVVMDPRFKLKLVEFSFSKIYGEDSAKYVKVVNDSIQKLYKEYTDQQVTLMTTYVDHVEANHVNGNEDIQPSTSHPAGDDLIDFDTYISEVSSNQSAKSELDQYLEESLVPRIQSFDILNWWKLNSIKYPCLSNMARDVLAIPVSTKQWRLCFAQRTGFNIYPLWRSYHQQRLLKQTSNMHEVLVKKIQKLIFEALLKIEEVDVVRVYLAVAAGVPGVDPTHLRQCELHVPFSSLQGCSVGSPSLSLRNH